MTTAISLLHQKMNSNTALIIKQAFNSIRCAARILNRRDHDLEITKEAAAFIFKILQSKLLTVKATVFKRLTYYHKSNNASIKVSKKIVQKDGGSADSRIDKGIIQNMVINYINL